MPVTTTIVTPLVLLQPGTFLSPPLPVPIGTLVIEATIDRSQATSPTLRFAWHYDLSVDGGATWRYWAGAEALGGVFFAKDGVTPVTTVGVKRGLISLRNVNNELWEDMDQIQTGDSVTLGFEPSNTNRMVRGSITVNESVTLGLVLKLYS